MTSHQSNVELIKESTGLTLVVKSSNLINKCVIPRYMYIDFIDIMRVGREFSDSIDIHFIRL